MKILKISFVLAALFALMLPSICVAEHHHPEADHAEVCSLDHTCCQSCHKESCLPVLKSPLVNEISSLEIPVRHLKLITVFKPIRPVFMARVRPAGALQRLQTVQLLI